MNNTSGYQKICVMGSGCIGLPTTEKTAEVAKLKESSSRDVKIAFANELSMICESEGMTHGRLLG